MRTIPARALGPRSDWRPGTTLLELLVAIAIIALIGSLALNAGAPRPSLTPQSSDRWEAVIASARHQAIEERRAVTVQIENGDASRLATIWPDGTVAVDSALHLSPFNGRRRDSLPK